MDIKVNKNIKIKKRLRFIDISKGILILMVVYGHVGYIIGNKLSFSSTNLSYIYNLSDLWNSFYMPAFFVITGYCSTFNYDAKHFVIKRMKSLIIPAFTLFAIIGSIENSGIHLGIKSLIKGEGFWFLYALFTAELIYYFINKIVKDNLLKLVVTLLIFVLGLFCHYLNFPEFWNYIHASLLLPFVFIGRLIKKNNLLSNRRLFYSSLVIYITLLSVFIFLGIRVPRVTGGIVLDFTTAFPFLILSSTGSFIIIYICKLINNSSLLEHLGKNSLVIYCVHSALIISLGNILGDVTKYLNMYSLCYLYLCLIISVTTISYFISIIINKKYFRILLGKF